MKFSCSVKKLIDGDWLAQSLGADVGPVQVTARSRDGALDLLRRELRYRMEWCPCSAVAEDYVELEVRDLVTPPWQAREL